MAELPEDEFGNPKPDSSQPKRASPYLVLFMGILMLGAGIFLCWRVFVKGIYPSHRGRYDPVTGGPILLILGAFLVAGSGWAIYKRNQARNKM